MNTEELKLACLELAKETMNTENFETIIKCAQSFYDFIHPPLISVTKSENFSDLVSLEKRISL